MHIHLLIISEHKLFYMKTRDNDVRADSLILEFLSEKLQGASIGEISSALKLNRNLVAKYLSIMHMHGRVELRSYGKVKIYRKTTRVPFHALSLVSKGCAIGLDQLLYVREILGNCKEMTGAEKSDFLSKPFSDIFHPAFTDPVVKKYTQDYRNGAVSPPLSREISWRKRGFNLTIVPCIFDDGAQGLALLLSEQGDIAPASKKEKNNIRTYQYLTHETPNFVLHLNADGDVLYVNESYATYCKVRASDLLHTNGIPLATQDDFKKIKKKVLKNWSLNEPTTSEIQVVMEDGSVRWQSWLFHPVREHGVLTELHGYGRDTTEEREREIFYIRLQKDFNQDVQDKTSELREITAQLRKEIDQRKALELALKKSEEKYRNLIEITTDIIWEADQFGTTTYINPKATSILGYPSEKLTGKKIWDKISPDYQDTLKNYFSETKCLSFEQIAFPMIRSDGSEAWIELSGIPLVNDMKQFSGYRGIGRDITRSKGIEEYNKRLLAIIENTPDIVRISDIRGNLLYMNKAGRKILKISNKTDITGCNNASFMSPEDWSKILEGRDIAIRDGIWQGLTTLTATDGTLIPVSQVIIAHKKGAGEEMLFSTVARDISDITRFRQKLEDANTYSRSLIEVNLDPLVTIGPDGKIQDVNHATEIVTGVSRELLIGTDFCLYFSEPDKAREGYEMVFSQGYVRDYPLEIVHKNCKITPVLYNASVYRDKSGKVQGVFAAARDISALREIEKNLAYSRDFYQKILDELPNPVWRSGKDGKCNYFNKAWFEFTGKTPEEEEDYGWSSGMHPDDKDRCMALYLSSVRKKIPIYLVYRLLHNDGTYHQVADYASPVHDQNGDFSGYIGSLCDLDKKGEI